jgi:uncharacterized protein YprB with RNaseH-like and TPR domain|tara:strand:- start:369 stop:1001 length:633 start_codon:yes stop_codon:yes gene_type:complete
MFFFDFETIPDATVPADMLPKPKYGNAKKPETQKKVDDAWAKDGLVKAMSVDPVYNKIICGTFIYRKDEKDYVDTIVDNEKATLLKFWELTDYYMSAMCGFNILVFDLPTAKFRSLVTGVEPTRPLPLRRYSTTPICDLAMVLCDWNVKNLKKLDFYLKRLGIPAKVGSGSDVYGWYNEKKAGGLDKIVEYNREEVKSIKLLHEKLTYYF